MRLKPIVFAIALLFASLVSAQDKTLYFMGIYPYNHQLNPAYSYNRSVVIISPTDGLSLSNSSLTFNTAFNRGEGARDTILYWDFETIEKKLKKSNTISADGSLNYFFAGKVLKGGNYASVSISRRVGACFSFPKSFVSLRYGNADIAGNKPRKIDLDNYNLDGVLYTEYMFGLSGKLSSRFSAGIHLKLLHGQMAVKTTQFLASVDTKDDFSQSTLKTDALIKLSAPVVKKEGDNNRIEVDKEELDKQLSWFFFSPANYGIGADIGFIADIGNRMTLSGSLNDVGVIHWGKSPQQLSSSGSYIFDGFYFSAGDFRDFDARDYLRQYTDTLQSLFLPEKSNEPFNTRLSAKSYLGWNYLHSVKLSFNALAKMVFSYDGVFWGITCGTVYTPVRRLSISGTWSYYNNSLYNIGLGAAYTWPRVQVFAATDNLNAINILDSKGANIAFGVSWLIHSGVPPRQGRTGSLLHPQ